MDNVAIGARLRQLRLARRLTQQQAADAVGADRTMLSRYETGEYRLDPKFILPLSELYGVKPNDLFATELPTNAEVSFAEVPVLGRVSANRRTLADQDIEGREIVPAALVKGGDHFYLRVCGNCMAPRIPDGSLALIRAQADVEDGEAAVVIVDGEEGTLKRLYRMGNDKLLLKADNPDVAPILVNASEVRILGKAVAFTVRL